jgi:acetolactate synthase-1/2/3 large subunit
MEKKKAWFENKVSLFHSDEIPIHMARVCFELTRVIPEDGILVADGGFAAHWTGLLYDTPKEGRTYVANRGNASIGYGLPAAIGAQIAAGESPMISITGDGGFQMSMGDMETAIREKIPFTLVVINNSASGYVKGLQYLMFEQRYQSSDFHEMNYAEIACSMGCHGIRVNNPNDLNAALKEGITQKSVPTLIDVVVTRDPAKMLPGVDQRTKPNAKNGDRIA